MGHTRVWRIDSQNPEDVLGFHDRRVGQHVVARPYLPIRCSVALGRSDRRTKQFIMESALAARVVAKCARQACKMALTAFVRVRFGGSLPKLGPRAGKPSRMVYLSILSSASCIVT